MDISGCINYSLSDHHLTYLTIKKHAQKPEKISFKCCDTRNYSKDCLFAELQKVNWDIFHLICDGNQMWGFLHKSYLMAVNSIAPITEINNQKQKNSWVSCELLSLIRERDDHKSKADSLNQNEHYIESKKVRNKVRRKLYTAKHDYLEIKIQNTKFGSKKYWDEINELISTGKKGKY